jgi:hypothetical protein
MSKFYRAMDKLKKGYQRVVKKCKDENGKLMGEEI